MKTILVANPKGGAGKTTLATNLSGALAAGGAQVSLWDLDRQKSSLQWLGVRSESLPRIDRLGERNGSGDVPKGGGWLVVDSPAGLHGKNLAHAIKLAERILVPVQPSLFDMAATGEFLAGLLQEKSVRKHGAFIGIIGMRVDPRTRAAATLEVFLRQFDLPVLTYLRDTQLYANAAFNGLSIFDLPPYASARDVVQWEPLLEWLRH
ncbi:MAG: ParA family protein [Betaproteobacteria bacterium]|nr:ParA family protein [Betaproteobacteria bacterium]